MLHIYYGFGKGKTSTLNGSAVRAKGANFKVALFRFLKGRHTSEDEQLKKLDIYVEKIHLTSKFVFEMNESEKIDLKKMINKSLIRLKKLKDDFDIFLFDEIIDLIHVKMITEQELITFLNHFKDKEIMLSGHYEFKELFKQADLITHYEAQKHYFDQKIKAREGIEY